MLVALAAACSGRRAPAVTADAIDAVGVYAGRLRDGDQATRFRALVWSSPPDRLHVEVVPPVGGPALIVDAGGGRLAITDARAGVSWVGAGEPAAAAMGRVVGLAIDPARVVEALLVGRAPDGSIATLREGPPAPSLPSSLRLARGPVSLELRLKRLRPLGRSTEELGTGRPPSGTERRPLDELADGEPLIESSP